MADATPRRVGWTIRPVPPTPRSIVELLRAGTLDAELAATLWVLIEARVPIVVAALEQGAGKTTLLTALLDFLPPGVRTVELAGSTETFAWLPQVTELGWTRPAGAGGAAPLAGPPVRPDTTVLLIPELSDHLPSYTWGAEARIAIRAASIGYGLAATIHADTLEEVFAALHRPPVSADDDELGRLGIVLILRRVGDGERRVVAAHYVRPTSRDEHGHVQRLGPAVLATWDPSDDTFEQFGWGVTPELAMRVGRKAGDFELEVDRRRDYLAGPHAGRHRRCRGRPRGARPLPDPSRRPGRQLRPELRIPMPVAPRPATVAQLRESGWQSRTVKEELRANLLDRLATGQDVLPTVIGYEETVLPAIENAILAGHDLVFLGERGQAKTRMARLLVGLLDEWLPIVRGGELNDDPYAPISPAARAVVELDGDDAPIDWLNRDRRYAEKLATPDITIADLIGEVDPIKVAEGRYLSDELTLHYGLIPRANRGIVAINELPDLAERIQVGLLNILEERDVQIRGFTVRLPLDLYVVASANPEDYTSRGRIITPLKDRLGSQVRTHYPRTLDHEMAIVAQEKQRFDPAEGVPPIVVPAFMEELVAELTHLARRSPEISQRSGVSVRVSVANMEVLEAAALKRAVRLEEPLAVPRVSDLGAVIASTSGKVELETIGDDAPEDRVVERLITKALYATFNRRVDLDSLEPVIDAFEEGFIVETGERTPSREYVAWMREVPGLDGAVHALGAFDATDGAEEPAVVASAVEFLLEGLHLARRLNKERIAGGTIYHR